MANLSPEVWPLPLSFQPEAPCLWVFPTGWWAPGASFPAPSLHCSLLTEGSGGALCGPCCSSHAASPWALCLTDLSCRELLVFSELSPCGALGPPRPPRAVAHTGRCPGSCLPCSGEWVLFCTSSWPEQEKFLMYAGRRFWPGLSRSSPVLGLPFHS